MRKLGRIVKDNLAETVAILLCLLALCGFVAAKEGFHMDELLCFELSNAEFNPWIVPTQPEGRLAKYVRNEIRGDTLGETLSNLWGTFQDVLQNRGNSKLLTYRADVYEEPVWITGEQFRDYITVGREDGFNYLSVYFNVKDDNHPPLHFMLLHTVSSVFRGRAEAWMGCLLNLIIITCVMVLLIRIGRLLGRTLGLGELSGAAGVCCAFCYGISAGAVATVLLIRMYGLLTLWCVAYFYLILRKWEDRQYDSGNIRLILITALGFWTQYFFLFYCLLLAAVVTVELMRAGRSRECFCFVRSMVIAAVLGVAVFPFSIGDVFSSGRGVEALGNLAEGLSGYGVRVAAFLEIAAENTFHLWFWLLLAVAAVPAFVLRRRGSAGKRAAVAAGGEKPEEKDGEKTAARDVRKRDRGVLVRMLLIPAGGYFLLAARMSPYLVDRYMMPVFPFVILGGVLAMIGLLRALQRACPVRWRKGMTAAVFGIVLLAQASGLLWYDGDYLYKGYAVQEATAEKYSGYPCICVYEGGGYYENLREFTHYGRTLLVKPEELENRADKESISGLDRLVVLVKGEVDHSRVLSILETGYGFSPENVKWIQTGPPFGDTIILIGKDE